MAHNDMLNDTMVCFLLVVFFAIADLEKFGWCNVMQQIKKVSPNLGKKYP